MVPRLPEDPSVVPLSLRPPRGTSPIHQGKIRELSHLIELLLTKIPLRVVAPPREFPSFTSSSTLWRHFDTPLAFAVGSIQRPTTCSVSVANSCWFNFFASLVIADGRHGFPARLAAVSIWLHVTAWNQLTRSAAVFAWTRLRPVSFFLSR